MDNEIIYIPYGQDEISQQDLMTSLANGVSGYLDSKRWAKKDKYRQAWLNAYQNIINRGITGASNDSGLWKIKHKGEDFNLNEMSNTEREMYLDAAYYIRNQMSQLPTRKKLEEEEQDKEKNKEKETKKTNYDNKQFQGGLTSYVSNLDYGGEESKKWINDWIKLDQETNGIYGREKRQAKLAEYLKGYRDKIEKEQDKWDFSKGPYGSYEEFNNRINKAIETLNNSEWNQDDIDALNRLGLDREAWLSNGENVLVPLTDQNGNVIKNVTRAEYNTLLEEQNKKIEEAKAKEEEEKKKKELEEQQKKLNQIKQNITKYKSSFPFTARNPFNIYDFANVSEIKSEKDIIPYLRKQLSGIKNLTDLTPYRKNLIHGGYKYAFDNKLLKPISEETWKALRRMKGSERFEGGRAYLHQIEGINNIIYNSYLNKIIFLGEDVPENTNDLIKNYRIKKKEALEQVRYRPYGQHFKQGGTLNNPYIDNVIEDFFKNNNI